MWGTLKEYTDALAGVRITPTCVGNTLDEGNLAAYIRDHPHLCGEHLAVLMSKTSPLGSPPPVWGTHYLQCSHRFAWGITPTCVGNTGFVPFALLLIWDHPHLCGEHAAGVNFSFPPTGSPPPVWGTRFEVCKLYKIFRITPTCVGNTFFCYNRNNKSWDHPHLCGEHVRDAIAISLI